MIRINLLPVKQQMRLSVGIRQLWLMALVVFLVVIILIGYFVKLDGDISRQEEEVARVSAEIERLEKLIGEVNELEADKKRLLKQLDVINELERGKTGPVRLLDAVANLIPKRVWLTALREQKQKLSLRGYGLETSDISDFMTALKSEPAFDDIQLQKSNKVTQRDFGQDVYEFELTAQVNYSK